MLYWVHLAMSRSLTHKLLGVKSLVEQILNIIIYIQCILKQKKWNWHNTMATILFLHEKRHPHNKFYKFRYKDEFKQ